ncbi:MAG TPA: phosphatidylglycerophosphatase A [Pirellulales bacterium]|nr:phosphatidylglycerophosphatase A [Pirellulales bacterium]
MICATGLGVGFFPFAPGTVGALWGLPLTWGLQHVLPAIQAVSIVAICLAGIPICTRAARYMGGLKDPGSIVLDEIASLPIVFFLIDMNNWRIAIAGFVLHRIFDITKPPPARQLERLPEGLGIMADDCAAAVYANLALRLVLWWNLI